MKNLLKNIAQCLAAVALLHAVGATPTLAEERTVNLYSYRQPFLIEPLLTKFTATTGIKVNIVFADKGMLERIRAAGANNQADAVLTVDIGRLYELKLAGVLEPVVSKTVTANVPAHLRDPENLWIGLTQRARVALVSKSRVKAGELTSYEDLASEKFRGRICLRSGKNAYNIALIAAMIAHHGQESAKKWLQGVKANLARKPQGNDRAQAKAIAEGICDIALANNYYLALMLTNEKEPEQKKWAAAVDLVYLNQAQGQSGNHMNVSGAGIVKGAKNKAAAVALIEFLSGDEAQKIYAEINHEYPVKAGVPRSALVASWGPFKEDILDMEVVAKNRDAAAKLVDEVRFDEGPTS